MASWGGTVDATNVQRVRNEIIGRSDGSPGQRFYLTYTPVVPREGGEYLAVRIDNDTEERWTEVSDFATSQPEDRHYTLDSRSGEIRLGPALPQRDGSIHSYGAVPPKESFIVMRSYRFGGGQIGRSADLAFLLVVLPPLGPLEMGLGGGGQLLRAHVRGGHRVVDAVPDRHDRIAGVDALAEEVALGGADVDLDADLEPGVVHQREHVGLLRAFARGLDHDLRPAAIGQKTDAVPVPLGQPRLVEAVAKGRLGDRRIVLSPRDPSPPQRGTPWPRSRLTTAPGLGWNLVLGLRSATRSRTAQEA